MRFEAVIFDCDGVLVDSEALALDDSAEYLKSHGLDWSPADLVRLFTGLRDDVFAKELSAHYRRTHGRDPAAGFFEGLIETRRRRRHEMLAVAGAAEAVAAIRLPRAVASSSRAEYLESKMRRTGIYDLFAPHVYSGDRVKHGKPAPDIFLYAAEKLAVAPAKCLVVEDSVNGVKAGCAAGMTVWGFTGGGHCFEGHDERLLAAGAERIVASFAALAALL